MNKLKLETGKDNKILRTKCKPVKKIDKKVFKEMKKLMQKKDGLGLAAPQIGIGERFFVIQLFRKNEEGKYEFLKFLEVINPKIIEKSKETEMDEEGCLSLPKVFDNVSRPKKIIASFFDLNNKDKTLKLEGMNARVFQHEYDHLEGILFIDYLKK